MLSIMMQGEVEVHVFFSLAVDGGEYSALHSSSPALDERACV
jgi:hypothetical protein